MCESSSVEGLEPRLFLSTAPSPEGQSASARSAPLESIDAPVKRSTHTRSRDIFGRDDRTRVRDTAAHPYAAVGLLESWWDDGSGVACTGALIGRYHVLTAAHCVYDDQTNTLADEVDFTPAFDRGDKPFGTVSATRFRIDANYPRTESSTDDYALVTLSQPLGDETGWFGFGNYKTSKYSRMPIHSTGYPGDLLDGNAMFTQRGRASYATADRIITKLDVALGQSGSPVYRDDNTIVGVLSSSSNQYTYATRITTRRFERLETWITKDERDLAEREKSRPLAFSTTNIVSTVTAFAPDLPWDDKDDDLL